MNRKQSLPDLTVYQTYLTAFLFLDLFWLYFQHKYDTDFPGLLSDMQFWGDNTPADPALKDDWLQAAQKPPAERISAEEAFNVMLTFLEGQCWGDDNASVLKLMRLNQTSPSFQAAWAECVDQVLHGSTDFIYLRFVKPGKRI